MRGRTLRGLQGKEVPPISRGGQGFAEAPQQTAGVWVVVNHPEMSLFLGLGEASTTKGGPACSRTACPPAPDEHNSFIQELHIHTKDPKGQCPESSQNRSLKQGDSIQGRSNRQPATESKPGRKHFLKGGGLPVVVTFCSCSQGYSQVKVASY